MIIQNETYFCSYRYVNGFVLYDFYYGDVLFDRDKCTHSEMLKRFLELREAPQQDSLFNEEPSGEPL